MGATIHTMEPTLPVQASGHSFERSNRTRAALVIGLLCLGAVVTLTLSSSTVSASPESPRRETSPTEDATAIASPSSVYFLGNSYTKRAELGAKFKLVAEQRNPSAASVTTFQRATDGKQLWQWMQIEKTANKKNELNAFKFNGVECPSVVVFQEQSAIAGFNTDQTEIRKKVFDSIKAYWGPKAKACNTRIAMYQTWGYLKQSKIDQYSDAWYAGWQDYDDMQDAVIAGTQRYADAIQAEGVEPIIMRVGEAYRRVKNDNYATFKKLYAGDGSHPGAHGKYLINQVFFSTMFAEGSADWKSIDDDSWRPIGVTLAEAKYLATIACSVALDTECSPDTQRPVAPTDEPTEAPTEAPTDEPTVAPTEAPTEEPTVAPTEAPTEEQTAQPTKVCKPWCIRKGQGKANKWRKLCNKKPDCLGCSQCDISDTCPKTMFCNLPKPGWNKKCKWAECKGCKKCT